MNDKNKIYTRSDEIKKKIYDDYQSNSVELNSLYFDFHVRASRRMLLETYAEIQYVINGDCVIRLKNPKIEKTNNTRDNIWGNATSLIQEGEYEDIYEGNYKDFLENFNGRELETGLCRVMEIERKEDLSGGMKLDFIF